MKNLFTLTFLFCSILSFSQTAFRSTEILLNHKELLLREDLNQLLEVYTNKTPFELYEKNDVEQLVSFMKDPFREDFNYGIFNPFSIARLDGYISENKKTKRKIDEVDYHLVLECNNTMPADYMTFIKDDKVVFSASTAICFENKYDEKYGIIHDVLAGEAAPDGVVDFIASEPFSEVTPPSLTTQVIDATSQFLVDRVKEELLLAFFDRFLAQVDQSTELTALMPNTYFLLKNNDVFKVPSMGEVWMTAFEEDLNSIPQNFNLMVQSHPDYADLKKKPELQLFLMAGFIFDEIQEKSTLLEFLESFQLKFRDADTQVVQMVNVIDLIRRNLLASEYGDEMVSKTDLRELFSKDKDAPLYFTALVYQQDKPLFNRIKIPQMGTQLVLGDLLKVNFVEFTRMTGQVLTQIKKLEDSKSTFDSKKSLKDTDKIKYNEEVIKLVNSFFSFFDFAIELAYFSNPSSYYNSPYFKLYRPVAQTTISAIDAGQRKDYGQLIIYSMQILEPLAEARINYLEKKLGEKSSLAIKKEIKILRGVVKNFMYYGGFMVDVLSANSTFEIKGIINKYAAPVGSYRVKRESEFSVSLSSYPGLYGGWETTNRSGANESFVTGVTAPIGLSLNWGNSIYGLKAKGHSFSLYASVIDIGAAFSYRWSNSEGEGFPEEIKWEQIISPGFHAVWGIGNSPMALMIGGQYTPLLRKITDQNNVLQPNAWRFGATVSVDIPIFHFFRSNK